MKFTLISESGNYISKTSDTLFIATKNVDPQFPYNINSEYVQIGCFITYKDFDENSNSFKFLYISAKNTTVIKLIKKSNKGYFYTLKGGSYGTPTQRIYLSFEETVELNNFISEARDILIKDYEICQI